MTDTQRDLTLAAGAALMFWIPGTADPYQAPRLLALGAAALWLLSRPAAGRSALEPWILAGLGAWVTAALFSRDAGYSVLGSYISPFDSLTAVLVYAALVVGVARVGATVEGAAEALCWAALPVAAYAIVQVALGGQDPLLPAPLPTMRPVSTQGSPVYLGGVLAIVAAAAGGLLQRRPRLALGTLALVLPALWLTGTRGAVLGAAAAAFVLLPSRWKVAACLAGCLAMFARHTAVDRADIGRMEIWRLAWKLFLEHPLTGTGPGTFLIAFRQVISPLFVVTHGGVSALQAHAHNQVLHVLATTGLVGLAGYLAVAGGAWRVIRAHPDRSLLTAAAAAYLVPAMLNPVAHSVTACLALLVGAAAVRTGGRIYGPVPQLLRAGCVLAVGLAGIVVFSDAHLAAAIYAGRANDPMGYLRSMRVAAALGLNDPRKTASYLDGLLKAMPYVDLETQRDMADESLRAAQELMRQHPEDAWSWEIAGRSVSLAAALGLPYEDRQAAEMFEVAQELAPTYIPIADRRLQMARRRGDKATERRARADVARLTAWTRGG